MRVRELVGACALIHLMYLCWRQATIDLTYLMTCKRINGSFPLTDPEEKSHVVNQAVPEDSQEDPDVRKSRYGEVELSLQWNQDSLPEECRVDEVSRP